MGSFKYLLPTRSALTILCLDVKLFTFNSQGQQSVSLSTPVKYHVLPAFSKPILRRFKSLLQALSGVEL